MKIHNLSLIEKLELAFSSKDEHTLIQLSKDVSSEVRRVVARNLYTTSEILHVLLDDCVQNVAYMASIHPNCKLQKVFSDQKHPCVNCERDERDRVCLGCKNLKQYMLSA